MTDNNLPRDSAPDVTEQNLERLLEKAYRPEVPDPDFVRRVREQLVAGAGERAPLRRWSVSRRRAVLVLAAAAAVAGLACLLNYLTTPRVSVESPFVQGNPEDARAGAAPLRPGDRERRGAAQSDDALAQQYAHLTPRPRPEAPELAQLAVGETLRTQSGERRRVALPDGSVLYLNQKTEVKLEAARRVILSAGEVFVEVAPRLAEEDDTRFLVKTPQREVIALGTKFDVAAVGAGTGVTVTQGQVRVSGVDGVLAAGQQLAPDAQLPTAAPRPAAALAWTRELMCAAEAPLVPPSKYAGGAIVVNDASGQQAQLSLRKYHIDVHIEDGFARTTIDQTYFNQTGARLEGTFYFPLPPDASLSRLAMYVNGKLMEGGMAERDFARQTFDSIVRKMQDPALLEWVDGSTFKMRVFPLEARQEKRIVLSYTQRLPVQYGRTAYRFPSGHSLEAVRDWSFHARVKGGNALTWASDTHADLLKATAEKGDLLLDAQRHNVKVEGDVALDLFDAGAGPLGGDSARFSSADHEGARYFMVRYRPELPQAKERRRRDWVFLFECSGDRDPLLARVQIEVIRSLLANAEHDDTFAIVTAATRAGTFAREARPATADNIAAAVRFLEGTHLAGVLDLGQALDAADPLLKSAQNPYLVHVGSGFPVLGEKRADVLARRVPDGVPYVGVGVGKHWNRGLMKAAAERSGGFFTQINPDEPVNWRSFELYSALTAPRLLDVKVVDNAEKVAFLTHTGAVAQGEEVCAIARLEGNARLPEAVTVTGTVEGKTFSRSLPVKGVAANAGYLPRTWARLEIDRLLAENAQANKARIVQLSMASYVMTPFTSLLVLENDQMYQQFGVDRGRKDHWAMYPCPETIPVVHEPFDGPPAATKTPAVKRSADEVLGTILIHLPPNVVADGVANGARAVTVRELYTGAFAVPVSVPLDAFGKDQVFNLWWGYDNAGQGLGKPGQGMPPGQEPLSGVTSSPVPGGMGPGGSSGGRTASQPAPSGPGGPGGGPMGAPGPSFQGGGAFSGGAMPPAGGGGGFPGGGFGQAFGSGGFGLGGGIGGFGGGSAGTGAGWSMAGNLHYTNPLMGGGSNGAITAGNVPLYSMFRTNPYYYLGSSPYTATYYPRIYFQGADDANGTAMDAKDRRMKKHSGLPDSKKALEEDAYLNLRIATELKRKLASPEQLDMARLTQEVDKGDRKALMQDSLKELGGIALRGSDPALMKRLADLIEADKRKPSVASAPVHPDALLYRRPRFAPDGRLFTDLVAFAPGLNTTQADILSVLEAEAADFAGTPGFIEPAARALIDSARAAGWRSLTVPTAGGMPAWSVSFDGSGRYSAERVLPSGLKEHVICDGKELLHLYAELGLGARRSVTRFHRAAFADLVPWALPPAKDLAHGFDVKCVAERIVALVPSSLKDGAEAVVVQLVFADDGRLGERRLVQLPKNTVLRRETYGTDGTLKLLDGEDKVLSERKLALKAGGAADLEPELKDLVVLPMPLRLRDYVLQQPGAASGNMAMMDNASCLAQIAADAAVGNPALVGGAVWSRTWNLGDTYPGFTALLLSAGHDVNALPAPPNNNHSPVARYVAWLKQADPSAEPTMSGGSLLDRLLKVQALQRRWRAPGLLTAADCARMLTFVREAESPLFVWAAVEEVLRTADKKVIAPGGRAKVQRDVLRAAIEALKNEPSLSYAARYEYARHLAENDERDEARKQFVALYEETAKGGTLPPVDSSFRQALRANGQEPDLFEKVLRDSADRLVRDGRRVAAVALAWQCWEVEAPAVADKVLAAALDGIPEDERRAGPALAAVEYLGQTHQYDRADRLLGGLLADRKFAGHGELWRMGYQLALLRKQPAQAFARLAETLEREYRSRPEWIDVQAVRRDYGALLNHYAEVVRATATLGQEPPADLAAKVVRAADRWRALDVDGTLASGPAFQSLRGLAEPDLAWDYLLMSAGADRDGFSWANLAQSLRQSEDFDLAERAYAQAVLAEPANADLARARAENLMQAGRPAEARELRRRVGETPSR